MNGFNIFAKAEKYKGTVLKYCSYLKLRTVPYSIPYSATPGSILMA